MIPPQAELVSRRLVRPSYEVIEGYIKIVGNGVHSANIRHAYSGFPMPDRLTYYSNVISELLLSNTGGIPQPSESILEDFPRKISHNPLTATRRSGTITAQATRRSERKSNSMKILRDYRSDNGLSQETVAQKLGVSRKAITAWECGNRFPNRKNLISIATLLRVSLEDLIIGDKHST